MRRLRRETTHAARRSPRVRAARERAGRARLCVARGLGERIRCRSVGRLVRRDECERVHGAPRNPESPRRRAPSSSSSSFVDAVCRSSGVVVLVVAAAAALGIRTPRGRFGGARHGRGPSTALRCSICSTTSALRSEAARRALLSPTRRRIVCWFAGLFVGLFVCLFVCFTPHPTMGHWPATGAGSLRSLQASSRTDADSSVRFLQDEYRFLRTIRDENRRPTRFAKHTFH